MSTNMKDVSEMVSLMLSFVKKDTEANHQTFVQAVNQKFENVRVIYPLLESSKLMLVLFEIIKSRAYSNAVRRESATNLLFYINEHIVKNQKMEAFKSEAIQASAKNSERFVSIGITGIAAEIAKGDDKFWIDFMQFIVDALSDSDPAERELGFWILAEITCFPCAMLEIPDSYSNIIIEPYAKKHWRESLAAICDVGKSSLTAYGRFILIHYLEVISIGIKSSIAEYWQPIVFPAILAALNDPDHHIKGAGACCSGINCDNLGESIVADYPALLRAIAPLFFTDPNQVVEWKFCIDNAAASLSRMITACPNHVPLSQVLPDLLKALPLKEDMIENEAVYGCLLKLLRTNRQVIMQHKPELVRIFTEATSKTSKVAIEIKQKLLLAAQSLYCDNSQMALGISPIILKNHNIASHNLFACEIAELKGQGFPLGLAKSITINNQKFPLRIWVVDNSSSMLRNFDGHIISEESSINYIEQVKGSRWSEIQQVVEYHSQMAHLLRAPTIFRLLNKPRGSTDPQQFSIGENGTNTIDDELETALRTIRSIIPYGPTPLSGHIREIRNEIKSFAPTLRNDEAKVVIILATDGLPTNADGDCNDSTKREFKEELQSLSQFPVSVVIRLCTGEDDVVEYYNSLDQELDISLEVLDDFSQEAKEIHKHNPWLNYSLPLHRCREMGYHNRILNILDERSLNVQELLDFCIILFGQEQFEKVPDPYWQWKRFLKRLTRIVQAEKDAWNPVTKKLDPWIDVDMLDKVYKERVVSDRPYIEIIFLGLLFMICVYFGDFQFWCIA